MKKIIISIAAVVALIALLAIPNYIHFPEGSAVTVSNKEGSFSLSVEDSAEIIALINNYGFWERGSRYYCDCYPEFNISIGEDTFSYSSGHLHFGSKRLLSLENEDDWRIYQIADRYLELE